MMLFQFLKKTKFEAQSGGGGGELCTTEYYIRQITVYHILELIKIPVKYQILTKDITDQC